MFLLRQVSVEQFRSTTRQFGGQSFRKLNHCSSIVVTLCHHSPPMASPSHPTFGIQNGRGRCCRQPQTAPSMYGTGLTHQLAADWSKCPAELWRGGWNMKSGLTCLWIPVPCPFPTLTWMLNYRPNLAEHKLVSVPQNSCHQSSMTIHDKIIWENIIFWF